MLSIATNENHLHGILRKYGWFNLSYLKIVKVSDEISKSDPYYTKLQSVMNNDTIVTEKILYKNTQYICDKNACVIIHEDEKKTNFTFGIPTKILVKKSEHSEIIILNIEIENAIQKLYKLGVEMFWVCDILLINLISSQKLPTPNISAASVADARLVYH